MAFEKNVVVVVPAKGSVNPFTGRLENIVATTRDESTDAGNKIGSPRRVSDRVTRQNIQGKLAAHIVIRTRTSSSEGRAFEPEAEIPGEEVIECPASAPSMITDISASIWRS